MTTWTFDRVSLGESYVLDIEARPGVLTLRLDLLLLHGHPEYRPPPPGEWACFRSATLTFPSVRGLRWNDQGRTPATDATGERDWGCLDSLEERGNVHRLVGDWGDITVESAPPHLSIDPTAAPPRPLGT